MEQIVGWSAVFAPAQLPNNVKDRLVAAMSTVAEDPQWRAMTAQTGSLPFIRTPEQTREFVQKQYELYRSLGESLNIIDANN